MPAANSGALAASMPAVLGGPPALTVGMVAAFISVSCIIAADTGAYFTGKAFGRTQVGGGESWGIPCLQRGAAGKARHWRGGGVAALTMPPLPALPCPAPLLQLTRVSPKKTVEGAVGGLLSSIGVALGLYQV